MNTSSDQLARRQRFDRLVAVYYPDMYRYGAWLSRDRSIAEDVVQEALLRAWKSLDALRDDAAAKHWLLTIVRRENARYFERKRLDMVDVDDLSPAQEALIAETEDEQLNEVREAIYRLEDDYREPLVLQVLMGYSTTEIAELMGLKQGAVLTRLHRARHKLKEVVEDDAAVAAGK
ncbi:MAG: sigma-70 family RNA polymerase sigma factor [Woeseiaceae bacterium]|nr:sigma-70 family RNA polymerase sigma factor [Woeseiaceae bacterium]